MAKRPKYMSEKVFKARYPYMFVDTSTAPPDTSYFESPEKMMTYRERLAKLLKPPEDKRSAEERAATRIATQSFGTLPVKGEYPGSAVARMDSAMVIPGYKEKHTPPRKQQFAPDRIWRVHQMQNRMAQLAQLQAQGRTTRKEDKELEDLVKYQKSLAPSAKMEKPEDVYLKDITGISKTLGDIDVDLTPGIENLYKQKREAKVDSLLNIDLSDTINRNTGQKISGTQARNHYEAAKEEAYDLMQRYHKGEIDATRQDIEDALDSIVQSHGFINTTEFEAHLNRIKDAKRQ